MNNKMTIVALAGIITLSLLPIKPLTNQVFAIGPPAPAKCSSELTVFHHVVDFQGVPKGQTTPVGLSGTLTNPCGVLSGASVSVGSAANCGTAFNENGITTSSSGDWGTSVNLGPCNTPYTVSVHFAGDTRCQAGPGVHPSGCFYFEPADASTTFSIAEATGNITIPFVSGNTTK